MASFVERRANLLPGDFRGRCLGHASGLNLELPPLAVTRKNQAVEGLSEHWSEYQYQSPYIGFVLEVLPEVKIAHPLVDDAEWVCFCGPPPDECYDIPVGEEVAYVEFLVKPLRTNR